MTRSIIIQPLSVGVGAVLTAIVFISMSQGGLQDKPSPVATPKSVKSERPATITVEQVMTVQQFRNTGLDTLTPPQRSALDTWLNDYTVSVSKPLLEGPQWKPILPITPERWPKTGVTPVVIVEPCIGGFKPVNGSSLGNTWAKSDVKPILIVKPGIFDFVPVSGSGIGNSWPKESIVPVVLLEPSVGGFTPMKLSTGGEQPQGAPAQPGVIESQIDGEFSGWEGETIVKLMNGQIWQQSQYHYEYHYAYMPDVLIYRSGSGVYMMKVEGTDEAVGVRQLK